jgi:polyphenol oxidase
MKVIKYFEEFLNTVGAFSSTKECGNLSFKWTGPNVVKNRDNLFDSLGLDLNELVAVSQPHGNEVLIADSSVSGRGSRSNDWIDGYDGLVAKNKNIILAVESADCVPVFAFDPEQEIIGIVHAGWQGVVGGAVKSLIDKMKELGSKVKDIRVAVGPHIQSCCFEVKNDILERFNQWPDSIVKKEEKFYVDLSKIIVSQLTNLDVLRQYINIEQKCTCCDAVKFYSYRRDKQKCDGGMLSFIKLKK